MPVMTRGVVYFVTGGHGLGGHYLRHAINSLNSLRRFHPDMHATLFCNDGVGASLFDQVLQYESVIDQYPNNEIHLDRVRCLADAPYDINLHLDADTYVDGPLDDLFQLMERFDVAARQSDVIRSANLPDVPPSFPDYSAGVLLWRWSPVTRKLFAGWARGQERWILEHPNALIGHGAHACQPSLRRLLYHSENVRLATLGDNYLCQVGAGGLIRGRAVILHGCRGHPGRLAKIAARLNDGQPLTGLGSFRYHCGMGSVVTLQPGRGLLPDDEWASKRKELLGA